MGANVVSAPLLMAYICMSALVWLIMLDLGEMTAYMPIRGLSVPYLVNRFVEPSLAFASVMVPSISASDTILTDSP